MPPVHRICPFNSSAHCCMPVRANSNSYFTLLLLHRPSHLIPILQPAVQLNTSYRHYLSVLLHKLCATCRAALQERDTARLASLMNKNFDERRETFGDAALGQHNLRMIALARQYGGGSTCTGCCLLHAHFSRKQLCRHVFGCALCGSMGWLPRDADMQVKCMHMLTSGHARGSSADRNCFFNVITGVHTAFLP